MHLSAAQSDRAAGVLLTTAAGDALGAGYEFDPPLPDGAVVTMQGGGPFGFGPGEWTDDTSMAIALAEALLDAAGEHRHPTDPMMQDRLVQAWADWARDARDVGAQTRSVLSAAQRRAEKEGRPLSSEDARIVAEEHHRRSGCSGGNGSLMRTAPLALAFLDRDEAELWQAAQDISALTHFDPEAGEACALWSLAIRRAVLTGQLDLRGGLRFLEPERADIWRQRIEAAEASRPRDFVHNGWVVEAFQGAWSAITTATAGLAGTVAGGPDLLRRALEEAVRGGHDTDTVAAIAGGLLGAAYGWSAVPFEWRRDLHGWPRYTATDLLRLGTQLVKGRGRTPGSWPEIDVFDNSGFIDSDRTDVVVHPLDAGVMLGGAPALRRDDYDAIVSLCRVGTAETHVAERDHAAFWLVDSPETEDNAHLDFVLRDAAAAVALFRSEGKRVLLHCVRAESRTPTVAALYGSLAAEVTPLQALAQVQTVLPGARPNARFLKLLRAQ